MDKKLVNLKELLDECSDIVMPETYNKIIDIFNNVNIVGRYSGCVDDDCKRILNILTHNSVSFLNGEMVFYEFNIKENNWLDIIRGWIKSIEELEGDNSKILNMLYNAEL